MIGGMHGGAHGGAEEDNIFIFRYRNTGSLIQYNEKYMLLKYGRLHKYSNKSVYTWSV
jgi:hypothetical protein